LLSSLRSQIKLPLQREGNEGWCDFSIENGKLKIENKISPLLRERDVLCLKRS